MFFNEPAPPLWPPIPGLLDSSAFLNLDFSKKNEWGADEWRTYAIFLEIKGYKLATQLCNTEAALIEQKKKASRRKVKFNNQPVPSRGLLSFFNDSGNKRGRKKSENLESLRYARMALSKRAEFEADGQKVTDLQALEAVFDDLKFSKSQKLKIGKGNILNRISKMRKS